MTEVSTTCSSCGAPVRPTDDFCESCGATLSADATAAIEGAVPMQRVTAPSPAPGAEVRQCRVCGGAVLDDGFCGTCGQRALSERDHWEERPAAWIAGVCDKGISHARNEDAMALAATAGQMLGVIVICDGVTSAPDSDKAALAAARVACARLIARAGSSGGEAATVSQWSEELRLAAADANAAAVGVAHALGDPVEPPSSTFVAAVVDGSVLTVAWVGDSRAYWLPDGGEGEQLTVDHSLGTEMVRAGRTQAEAEADPTCHTITRWLGADSSDATPELASRRLDAPGWLLVCSDGLWNYASSPVSLRELVDRYSAAGRQGPLQLSAALVEWANAQGGHDNITAALARIDPSLR